MKAKGATAEQDRARVVRASCERIAAELGHIVQALAPSEAVLTHFRAARVEALKGLRAAIDARIAEVERRERKGRSVTVE